jgi:hypothetical protein
MTENSKNTVSASLDANENIIVGDGNVIVTKDDTHCLLCKFKIEKKELKENGNVICQKCLQENRDFGIRNPEKNIDYANKIFLVFAFIKTDEHEKAMIECDKAIDISPLTFNAWAYKALIYYLMSDKQAIIITNAEKIIQYIDVAHSQINKSEELDNIAFTIAERINLVILSRIAYIRSQSLSNFDRLKNLLFYIEKWFVCYNIFPKIEFLENIVNHLSGQVQEGWVDIEIVDFAGNYKVFDRFNVNDKINFYTKIIKSAKQNYKKPENYGCEDNKYPPMPLGELYKFKTQREITKKEILEKALPQVPIIAEKQEIIQAIIQEKPIQTIEELIANGDFFRIYQISFLKSLIDDWKPIFNHDNAFKTYDNAFYRDIFIKKQFIIEGLIKIPSWYELKLDVNVEKNLPLNYMRNLEILLLKKSNIEFLPFIKLPKLSRLSIEDCYKGFDLIGGRFQGIKYNFDKSTDLVLAFQANNPNCKIIINNVTIY